MTSETEAIEAWSPKKIADCLERVANDLSGDLIEEDAVVMAAAIIELRRRPTPSVPAKGKWAEVRRLVECASLGDNPNTITKAIFATLSATPDDDASGLAGELEAMLPANGRSPGVHCRDIGAWAYRHAQEIRAALRQRPDAMREALEKARDKFREYECLHEAKARAANPGGSNRSMQGEAAGRWAKAERNREMADMCDAALRSTPAPVRPTSEVERLRTLPARLQSALARPGVTVRTIEQGSGVSKATVSRASRGMEITANSFAALEDWLNAIERREWETSDAPEDRGEGEQS